MPRLLLPLLLLAPLGCRPAPDGVTLAGRVSVGGAPLTAGSVLLQSDKPRWATVAIIAADGSFRADGVPPGPVRVGVRTRGVKAFDGAAPPARVPRRYEDPATSGLLVEAGDGDEVRIDLPAE